MGGRGFIFNHAENILHVAAVLDERISGRGQDQSLNLGEFNTLQRVLERGRNEITRPSYLQCMEIREGLEAFDERRKGGLIPRKVYRHEPS